MSLLIPEKKHCKICGCLTYYLISISKTGHDDIFLCSDKCERIYFAKIHSTKMDGLFYKFNKE